VAVRLKKLWQFFGFFEKLAGGFMKPDNKKGCECNNLIKTCYLNQLKV